MLEDLKKECANLLLNVCKRMAVHTALKPLCSFLVFTVTDNFKILLCANIWSQKLYIYIQKISGLRPFIMSRKTFQRKLLLEGVGTGKYRQGQRPSYGIRGSLAHGPSNTVLEFICLQGGDK